MYDFKQDIKILEAEMASSQESTARIGAALEQAASKVGEIGIELNIDDADLTKVQEQNTAMTANIAALISGLDGITQQFGTHFDEMKQQTGIEKLVGIVWKSKAAEMRDQRIRTADIDKNLNELIAQSNQIKAILVRQLGVLQDQRGKVTGSLQRAIEDRIRVTRELDAVNAELTALDPRIIEIENRIAVEPSAAVREELRAELQKLNETHNELDNKSKVKLALAQSLEKYVGMYQTFVESLQDQIAAQQVLINKLETDTTQRAVLYDALSKSLKTAQQQDTAHRINEIGSKVDAEAHKTMAYIGAGANNALVTMLESHEGHMVDMNKVRADKEKADERFYRRFGTILEKHDTAKYTAGA